MRHFIWLFAIGFSLNSGMAFSQEIAECHSFTEADIRLKCYDQNSGYQAPVDESSSNDGGWILIEQMDDFTNANTSYVVLRSDASGVIMSDAPEAMIARCDGNGGHEIYVKSGGYIGARNDLVPVRYRFGEAAPVSERWHESTTGTAAFLPNGFKDFRNGLRSGEDFVFEITDYNGTSSRARFENVSGNQSALEFVLNGCE